MDKTKIEYCDASWNAVTGCFHGCEYCYARRIAGRFGMGFAPRLGDPGMEGACKYDSEEAGMNTMLELEKPYVDSNGKTQPYPMGFYPTFHRYRLDIPSHWTKPRSIFVCSMADLFGEWVPDEWIEAVFAACAKAPQHRYLFLTKNPGRFQNVFLTDKLGITRNMWFGFSVDSQQKLNDIAMGAKWLPQNTFVSVEPLHAPLTFAKIAPTGVDAYLNFLTGGQYWFMGGDNAGKRLKWVIIGAESGPKAKEHAPKAEWVAALVKECAGGGIPVFMKESLIPAVGEENMLRQFPWEVGEG